MIVDTLANAGRYRGLSPLLDRALEAMERLVSQPPADGRHELSGADLYASLSSYATGDPAAKGFEAHRRYIDIQVVLQGQETLYWAPLASLEPRGEYSETKDIAFYAGQAGVAVPLEPGWFTVLFPQDAHKPGCLQGSSAQVRKLVIKVAV
jgi:biofilm protein TabA